MTSWLGATSALSPRLVMPDRACVRPGPPALRSRRDAPGDRAEDEELRSPTRDQAIRGARRGTTSTLWTSVTGRTARLASAREFSTKEGPEGNQRAPVSILLDGPSDSRGTIPPPFLPEGSSERAKCPGRVAALPGPPPFAAT